MKAPVPSAARPGSAMGLPQWPFRSLATEPLQPTAQFPAEAHDTKTSAVLSLAGSWIARRHRPFTSLTTNGGRPPPAAQLARAGHDKEKTPVMADDAVLALNTVVKWPHLPLCSRVTKA